jgi:hypothetical protein
MSTSLDPRPRVKRRSIPANPVRHGFSGGVAACHNGFTKAAHSRCPPDPILANDNVGGEVVVEREVRRRKHQRTADRLCGREGRSRDHGDQASRGHRTFYHRASPSIRSRSPRDDALESRPIIAVVLLIAASTGNVFAQAAAQPPAVDLRRRPHQAQYIAAVQTFGCHNNAPAGPQRLSPPCVHRDANPTPPVCRSRRYRGGLRYGFERTER